MKKFKFRITAILLVVFLLLYGTWELMNSRSYQVFGELVNRVDTQQKVVALTFDDGPTEKYVDEVLAILDETDVKATFFVIGGDLEKNMAAGKKIVQAGHQLGNHTYSHQRMIFHSQSFIDEELKRTDSLIREAGYTGDILFRPPNGKKLLGLPYYLSKSGRTTIMWDVEPESTPDETNDSRVLVDRVVTTTKPGSIIILHPWYDSRESTRQAIKDSILALKKQGYQFVTVSELMSSADQ
ncbi:MAG: polysaccharide deacetylase family protein [Tumebacillaceae bacterium]